MQVAVIDDGIAAERLSCPKSLVLDLVVKHLSKEKIIVRKKEAADFCPALHGTYCARILEHYIKKTKLCERSLELISLCIFDTIPLQTDCEKLIAALEWCLVHQISLIHMSVGTRELSDYEALYQITARLIQQGAIIVAAGNNAGTYTMPACLGGVLGVATGRGLVGGSYRYQDFQNGICLAASAVHSDMEKDFFSEKIPTGVQMGKGEANSYAAPTVTAAIYQILEKGEKNNPAKLFQELVPGKRYQMLHPDFIKSAVLRNLSGADLIEDCFFFHSILDERPKIEEQACLVLVPGEDRQKNQKVMEDFIGKEKSVGMLYAGRLQEFLHEKFLFWSEEDCGAVRWTFEKENADPIPCVWIRTGQQEGVRLVCRLYRQFREQGYQCVAASNWEYAYLYGLEYIPPEADSSNVLFYLKKVYTPDLILFLEQEGKESGIRQLFPREDVYEIKEEAFEKKGLYDEIIQYFS